MDYFLQLTAEQFKCRKNELRKQNPLFCKNYIMSTMQQGMASLFYLEYEMPKNVSHENIASSDLPK